MKIDLKISSGGGTNYGTITSTSLNFTIPSKKAPELIAIAFNYNTHDTYHKNMVSGNMMLKLNTAKTGYDVMTEGVNSANNNGQPNGEIYESEAVSSSKKAGDVLSVNPTINTDGTVTITGFLKCWNGSYYNTEYIDYVYCIYA